MASESLPPEVQDTPSVYICYARSDPDFVRKLNEVLQKHSIRTWINSENVDPGVKRNMSDFSGIDETSAFLFVMSPDAVASDYCISELNYAFERRKDIVKVLRRAVDSESVPTQLASLQPIYFRAEDDPYEAFRSLVRAIDPDIAMDVDPESIRSVFRRPEPARSSSVPTHPDRPAQIDLLERRAFAEALAVRIRTRRQKEEYSLMVHIWTMGLRQEHAAQFLG
jgi:hypothetical protein